MSSNAPPMNRRERRKQEVRGRITEAAIALFESKGVDAATVEEICERADVARKTFYNYYAGKQQLIDEITDSLLLEETDNIIDLALERYTSTGERLGYLLAVTAENLTGSSELERQLVLQSMMDVSANVSRSGTKWEWFTSTIERLYTEGHRSGDIQRRHGARFLAEMTVGMITALTLSWVHNPDYPVTQRIDELHELLLSILQPAE